MKTKLLFLTSIILLAACSPDPEAVAKTYWRGLIDNDTDRVTQASSQNSRAELRQAIAPNPNNEVRFGETQIEEGRAQVETFLTWKDDDKESEFELFTVLTKEDKQWKVDTARTRQQFFTAVYRTRLDGLSSVLAESLASFQVLGEQAAGTMAEDISALIDELQQQSEQANTDAQVFLQSLDQDLRKAIESVQEPK